MNVSGYVGHMTILSWMLTIVCSLAVRIRMRVSVWLVTGYSYDSVLLSVVTETDRDNSNDQNKAGIVAISPTERRYRPLCRAIVLRLAEVVRMGVHN